MKALWQALIATHRPFILGKLDQPEEGAPSPTPRGMIAQNKAEALPPPLAFFDKTSGAPYVWIAIYSLKALAVNLKQFSEKLGPVDHHFEAMSAATRFQHAA